MRRRLAPWVVVLPLLALGADPARADADFFILNVNIGPTGFNDPTPVPPAPGNPGGTLGAQRLAVFNQAAAKWGQLIESEITIVVQSAMNPLFCAGGAAALGTAASFTAVRDFDGAPLPDTWYHAALARALAADDLMPGYPDMFAIFNTAIDDGCIPGIDGWYYGTDGNPPPGTIELFPIVLHEIAHGLGFANLASEITGSLFQGIPDIYTRFTFDHVAGQTWADMATDGERAASALRCGEVSWSGPRVTAEAPAFLAVGAPELEVLSPAAIAGPKLLARARFGPPLPPAGITAPIVLADDGAGTVTDGCEGPATTGTPWINAAQIAGSIAMLEGAGCPFSDKVRNAQESGAVAVVVAHQGLACPPFEMEGDDDGVLIPAGRITFDDGQAIMAALPGVTARIGLDASRLAGTEGTTGQVLLFATDPLLPGSAISHFDTSPFPDVLMEPFANLAGRDIGLTYPHLRDLGWQPSRSIHDIPALRWRGLGLLGLALLALGVLLLRRGGVG